MSQHNRPKIPVSKYLSTVFRYYGSAFYVFPPAPILLKVSDTSKHRNLGSLLPVPRFVHPSRQKSQTSALAFPSVSRSPTPVLSSQAPRLLASQLPGSQLPAPHTQLTSKRHRVQVTDSRFLNFLVSQQHRFCTKSQTSHNTATSYAYHDCVII